MGGGGFLSAVTMLANLHLLVMVMLTLLPHVLMLSGVPVKRQSTKLPFKDGTADEKETLMELTSLSNITESGLT